MYWQTGGGWFQLILDAKNTRIGFNTEKGLRLISGMGLAHVICQKQTNKLKSGSSWRPQVCRTSDFRDLVVNSRRCTSRTELDLWSSNSDTNTSLISCKSPTAPLRRLILENQIEVKSRWPCPLTTEIEWVKDQVQADFIPGSCGLGGRREKTNIGTRFSSGGLLKFSVTAVAAGSHSLREHPSRSPTKNIIVLIV